MEIRNNDDRGIEIGPDERARWQRSAKEQIEITRRIAVERDKALAEAKCWRDEYRRVNARVFEYRAEIEQLQEALSSALGYLSAEEDDQARRICQEGRAAFRELDGEK